MAAEDCLPGQTCFHGCVVGYCHTRYRAQYGCEATPLREGIHEAMVKSDLDLRSKSQYICRRCLQVMEFPKMVLATTNAT